MGKLEVEKILPQKVSERVAEQIEKFIEAGKFKPGEKLPSVRELCEWFDVGRSAVRDAITTLKGKGLVHVKQGEGSYICEFDSTNLFTKSVIMPDVSDIVSLFEVRKILETGIVEQAAHHHTKTDIDKLEQLIRLMEEEPNQENWELDYQFHMLIANASGNHILAQLMDFISSTMKKVMIDFHLYIAGEPSLMDEIADQHEQIVAQIKAGDGKSASEQMIAHLQYVEELMHKSVLQSTSSQIEI